MGIIYMRKKWEKKIEQVTEKFCRGVPKIWYSSAIVPMPTI